MKKNNLIISIFLSALCTVAQADLGAVHAEASGDPSLKKVMESKLPLSDSGIQIVPTSEMPSMGNPSQTPTAFRVRSLAEEKAEEEKLGYINVKSDDAVQLLEVKNNKFYASSKKVFTEDKNPYDTHLKASLAQIKLAFPFKGISFVNKENIIGYAVAGTWKDGWTGVAETFNEATIGTCDYVKHNLKITHGGAKLAQEYVTYAINSKPTIAYVEGQEGHGFTYKVEWFDDTFFHTLKCASLNFVKENKERTINLAKKIDLDPQ